MVKLATLISVLAIYFLTLIASAQNTIQTKFKTLSFESYLAYVKKHHPIIKQANLKLSIGEAKKLKAKGGFDPKINIDYNRKKFKDIEYYDELNATFKIPTWYGIEFKANFEENTGEFLNPRLDVPEGGLYSAGVSFSLAQGLLINDRMADVKKARYFLEQTKAERDLLVNKLIFEASKSYFEWLEAFNEQQILLNFLDVAKLRFKGVKRNVEVGEKAAIDSIEAKISYQNRQLGLEAAKLKTMKATLKASNFLWVEGVPLEIEENIAPEAPSNAIIETSLFLEGITSNTDFLTNHPKLRSFDAKIKSLEVDQFLKKNKLLPKVGLEYSFLSTKPEELNTFNTAEYKAGFNLSYPIFLRKERGDLKLAKLKLKDANFDRATTLLQIQNKVTAITFEINSLQRQNKIINNIIDNYKTMLKAEERKFSFGESSLFLINSREQKLIEASIKANNLFIKALKANAKRFNVLGLVE